jgi:pre-rRNA-processing protein IPI3
MEDDIFNDYSLFIQPETSESSGSSLQSRVTELESEVAGLRDQLGKAKGVNDVMWETVVQRLVSQGSKEPKETGNVDFDEESTRRRKKNRA